MGKEEQVEEREVLDSIFPEEITDIDETQYRISVTLDTTNDDGDDSEPPTMLMSVKYPEAYPDEAPEINLTSPPNAPSHTYFNLASDKDELLESVASAIEDNLGMAMIFTLYSTLKDSAETLITNRQAAAREVQEQRIAAQEAEENEKFQGEPVTPETFERWRLAFKKEMEDLKREAEEIEDEKEKKKNRGKETVDKLTGRQLWERGLAGKGDEDDEGDDGIMAGAVEKLKLAA